MPTLTVADFSQYVDIPANLPPSKLNRHIELAKTLDVRPLLDSQKLYNVLFVGDFITPASALDDFYQNYVKPYWIFAAFVRFELKHGADITQAGLKEHTSDNSENVSDKRRSDILSRDHSDANVYKSMMLRELENQRRTFDNEEYLADSVVKVQKQQGHGWSIHAVSPHREFERGNERYGYRGYEPAGGKVDYNPQDYN